MNRKPKIAIIGVKGLPAIGGAARANEALTKYLSNQFDLTIYEIDTHKEEIVTNSLYKSIVFKGNNNKRLNTFIYYLKSCCHALIKGDFDIVHTQHIYSGFIIPFLKVKYKVVNTVHGIIPRDDNKWNEIDKYVFRLFEKMSLAFSDIVVSVSYPQIKYLESLSKKKIIFIPNGVDLEDDLLKKRENVKKEYLVFSAARIIKLKGCHTFLRALTEADYQGKIKVIGSLEHVKKYKEELLSLANGLDVSFLGLISDKAELFNQLLTAKYFIFPSTKEGLSNMLLEVASLNIPIICSDIEENRAVFNEDEVLFFKTEDFKDLANKIMFAEVNEKEMKAKANNALKRLKKDYLWSNISDEYSYIYMNLLS